MKTKGLLVHVYTDGGADCTNNGISSKNKTLILNRSNSPFEGDETNSVELHSKVINGNVYNYVTPLHEIWPSNAVGPMFGGNFIYSSDSRFPAKYPIPIHDRFE